ncbi:MAG: hypothetical protein K2Y23_21435 [Cyanobacteria bacterium]|nr:hypothetical protein [Cyanobacteriota bacterium]
MPRPSDTPAGVVVVNVTDTVPLEVRMKSRLAALPGLMMLENELTSTGVAVGDVMTASSQAVVSAPTKQMAASPALMGVSSGS